MINYIVCTLKVKVIVDMKISFSKKNLKKIKERINLHSLMVLFNHRLFFNDILDLLKHQNIRGPATAILLSAVKEFAPALGLL